jgi:hypothetical protein
MDRDSSAPGPGVPFGKAVHGNGDRPDDFSGSNALNASRARSSERVLVGYIVALLTAWSLANTTMNCPSPFCSAVILLPASCASSGAAPPTAAPVDPAGARHLGEAIRPETPST